MYFITDLLTSLKIAIHKPVTGKTIYSLFCDAYEVQENNSLLKKENV